MSFIRYQNIIEDSNGKIVSGSAEIVESVYTKGAKHHSTQRVVEKLGRVIERDLENKEGVFFSETRGLVRYNSRTNQFKEISEDEEIYRQLNVSLIPITTKVFGDMYLLLEILKEYKFIDILQEIFKDQDFIWRVISHISYGVLKDGSRITCEDFIFKSFASYFMKTPTSLASDTYYFNKMGKEEYKISFFKSFIDVMKKEYADFGKVCYVDSTPLPNEIVQLVSNAYSTHGTGISSNMSRLVVVLDSATGFPVWFNVIGGNILDLSTLNNISYKVEDLLGIEIIDYVLDAGYASKEIFENFGLDTEKTILVRMPARKGYPFKELYSKIKKKIYQGKYQFVRNDHRYFGVRQDITLFEKPMCAYVYVDLDNAIEGFKKAYNENPQAYEEMTNNEKDFESVRYGYFVLIHNRKKDVKAVLDDYLSRIDIESYFKTSKHVVNMLPLSKWTKATVDGKLLNDTLVTIITILLRKILAKSKQSVSLSKVFGKTSSLFCRYDLKREMVMVETPSKDTKTIYKVFEKEIPTIIRIDEYVTNLLKKETEEKPKKKGRKSKIPHIR